MKCTNPPLPWVPEPPKKLRPTSFLKTGRSIHLLNFLNGCCPIHRALFGMSKALRRCLASPRGTSYPVCLSLRRKCFAAQQGYTLSDSVAAPPPPSPLASSRAFCANLGHLPNPGPRKEGQGVTLTKALFSERNCLALLPQQSDRRHVAKGPIMPPRGKASSSSCLFRWSASAYFLFIKIGFSTSFKNMWLPRTTRWLLNILPQPPNVKEGLCCLQKQGEPWWRAQKTPLQPSKVFKSHPCWSHSTGCQDQIQSPGLYRKSFRPTHQLDHSAAICVNGSCLSPPGLPSGGMTSSSPFSTAVWRLFTLNLDQL